MIALVYSLDYPLKFLSCDLTDFLDKGVLYKRHLILLHHRLKVEALSSQEIPASVFNVV